MSVLTNDAQSLAAPSSRPLSRLDRMSRAVLTGILQKFPHDQIILCDGATEQAFGHLSAQGETARVVVLKPRFYRRLLTGGSLGAAEAYLDEDWRCDDLSCLLRILVRNLETVRQMDSGLARLSGVIARGMHWLRKNTRQGSRKNIEAHYDLGNDFFRLFLDETMMYSSGIFSHPQATLYEASVTKLDRICRQLYLRQDDHLLEIGTGWGGFAIYAARHFGCRVTTTTISREQFELATARIREAGLEDRISVVLQDYRDLSGQYDKLVSIEMIEAVGCEFFDTYFRQCSQLLRPNGLMLIQGIVMNEQRYAEYVRSTDFIQRYIFPGGCLPSVVTMGKSIARATNMRILLVEDFAPHYAQTLRCWRERFWKSIDQVREMGFTERFIRMWHYYLCYCEAAFDERFVGVVQMLLAKPANRRDLAGGHSEAIARPHLMEQAGSQT